MVYCCMHKGLTAPACLLHRQLHRHLIRHASHPSQVKSNFTFWLTDNGVNAGGASLCIATTCQQHGINPLTLHAHGAANLCSHVPPLQCSRPRGSQIGAAASQQSAVLASREELERQEQVLREVSSVAAVSCVPCMQMMDVQMLWSMVIMH